VSTVSNPSRSSAVSWLGWAALSSCFWTAVALVFVVPKLAQSSDWRGTLLSSLAQWWSWGLLAPVITAIDARLPFSGNHLARRILVHLVLGPAFTVVYAYLSACVAAAIRAGTWSQVVDAKVLAGALHEMFWSMLVYGLIVGVWEAYHYQQRYVSAELRMERLERNFSAARLNSLRMQLDPHFLFNALNTISAQVEPEPRLARKMIEHLGDLLRLSLSSHSRPVIALVEELAFLDHYLAIQKMRFGHSLRVEIYVSPEVSRALVPSMFLQPLVENAIRHGLAPRSGGGTIILSAERAGDNLHVRVLDDGVGLPSSWSPHSQGGLGLSVTRERIAGLHPQGSSHFSIHPRAEGGTAVEIYFPLRLTEEIDDRRFA
jgi:two-component system LytT family sensor kinase